MRRKCLLLLNVLCEHLVISKSLILILTFYSLFGVKSARLQEEGERFFTVDENGNLLEAKEIVYTAENDKTLVLPKHNMASSLIVHSTPPIKVKNFVANQPNERHYQVFSTEAHVKKTDESIDLPKTLSELDTLTKTEGSVLKNEIISANLIHKDSPTKILNNGEKRFEYSKTFLPLTLKNSAAVVQSLRDNTKTLSNTKNFTNRKIISKPSAIAISLRSGLKKVSSNATFIQNTPRTTPFKILTSNQSANLYEKEKEKSTVIKKIKKLNEAKLKNDSTKIKEKLEENIENTNSKNESNDIYLRNMLTNSTMKGYLSKNSNFTIEKVGAPLNSQQGENKLLYVKNEQSQIESLVALSKNHANANQTSNNSSKTSQSASSQNYRNHSLHLADTTEFVKLISSYQPNHEEADLKTLKKTNIAECSSSLMCPVNKYCLHFLCNDCQLINHACIEDDHCCEGLTCIYGRCDKKEKGSPGSICDKDSDCNPDSCCVIEPTIYKYHGTCKRKLEEYHQCAPVLFRKVWIEEEKPKCGPCKEGLKCSEKGVIASHLVCMKH